MSASKKTYHLKEQFGTFLWGRHIAVALRDEILRDAPKDVVFDFEGVTFVTRAFADELRKVQGFLAHKDIKVSFNHVAPIVNSMLNLVVEHARR